MTLFLWFLTKKLSTKILFHINIRIYNVVLHNEEINHNITLVRSGMEGIVNVSEFHYNNVMPQQRGGLMDRTFGLSAGRSRVLPGQGKCSLRTMAVDAKVNQQLYLTMLGDQGFESRGR